MANVLSYNDAKKFKEMGVSQSADKFYENSSKEIFNAADIHFTKDFSKKFTAALDGDDLDAYLPVDSIVRKSPLGWFAILRDISGGPKMTAVGAKFELLCKLIKKGVVKL